MGPCCIDWKNIPYSLSFTEALDTTSVIQDYHNDKISQ